MTGATGATGPTGAPAVLGEEFPVLYGTIQLLGDLTITPMYNTTTKQLVVKALVDSQIEDVTINRQSLWCVLTCSADFFNSSGTNLGACSPLIDCTLTVAGSCTRRWLTTRLYLLSRRPRVFVH